LKEFFFIFRFSVMSLNSCVLVALLAVCACVVSATVSFDPHPLPCDFSIIEESNATIVESGTPETTLSTITVSIHGALGMIVTNQTVPTPYFQIIVARTDIRFSDSDSVMINIVEDGNDEFLCSSGYFSRLAVAEEIDQELGLFTATQEFENVSNSEFEGKKCKAYYRNEDDVDKYVFVDDDNFILGQKWFSGDSTFYIRYTYKMSAPLENFVLDHGKYPGCTTSAYEIPVVDTCGNHEFTPHSLPCAFTITEDNTYKDNDGNVLSADVAYFYIHGSYGQVVMKETVPVKSFSQTLVRSDITEDDTVAVFHVDSFVSNICNGSMMSRSEVANNTRAILSMFLDPLSYEAISQKNCSGNACTTYFVFNKEKSAVEIYSVLDGYIVELCVKYKDSKAESSFVYDFKAPLKTFIIDKQYPGCEDEAYIAPTDEPCASSSSSSKPKPSSSAPAKLSSSSSACTISANFGIVICALVIVLFSFF